MRPEARGNAIDAPTASARSCITRHATNSCVIGGFCGALLSGVVPAVRPSYATSAIALRRQRSFAQRFM
jgi:hypothetical protein